MNQTSMQTRQETGVAEAIEKVLMQGDLSKLTPEQRMDYYRAICNSLRLNHLTRPFDYITLNGKLTLYAKKDATDQLRRLYAVSITSLERETIEGVYLVTAHASVPGGREDTSTGAVSIKGLQGDALANAFMKAETKAKRRATLSICGLGMLDETEASSIPGAEMEMRDVTPTPQRIAAPAEKPPPWGMFVERVVDYLAGIGVGPDEQDDVLDAIEANLNARGKRDDKDALQAMWKRVKAFDSSEGASALVDAIRPAVVPVDVAGLGQGMYEPED